MTRTATTIRKLAPAAAIAGVLVLGGCAGMSPTEQRVLSGGAIGAGAGALLGGVTGGSPTTGAILGGALGAGGGYLYDRHRSGR